MVVKVVVNQAGDVTDAILQPGGSAYFGRLAVEAARKWRFVSSSDTPSRKYDVRFEIAQTDTRAVLQKAAK